MLDSQLIKQDFPILHRNVHGNKPLVYLDNAATSQKPIQVIDAISNYYKHHNANVHRGVHVLSDESTQLWEDSRKTIAKFFGADDEELVIVRNTTEAINGIVYGWALDHLQAGDVVLSTEMEHHSNLVPWQEVCKKTGAKLELIAVDDQGRLDLEQLETTAKTLKNRLKMVALAHVSNTLGTLNPVNKVTEIVKIYSSDTRFLVDGAQSISHLKLNFHTLNVDFFIFSGHKMLGPMGIGGILVKKELLQKNELKPWLFGGGMIESVYPEYATFHEESTQRFTAGTPDVASLVGLAEACHYLEKLGMNNVEAHDRTLVSYAIERLQELPQIKIIGPTIVPPSYIQLDRIGSVAFIYDGVHPHDVAQVLDSEGIAVRSGHHCTMPLHTKFNWAGTTRISFQVYNSKEDIDVLVKALQKVKKIFGK